MGNRYLEQNYAPVSEEVTVTDLPVTGTLPFDLDGRYLRNGPNPIVAPDPGSPPLVHRRRHGARAAPARRQGRVVPQPVRPLLERGQGPGGDAPGRLRSTPTGTSRLNTNAIVHDGRTFAIVEAGARPYELTDELDTIGPCDLDGTLPGGYTAHPKRDPQTGELHAMSYFWGWGNKVQYTVVGTDGRVRRVVDVETTGSPMVHDCSLTESSVIIYDLRGRRDGSPAAQGPGPTRVRPVRRQAPDAEPVAKVIMGRMLAGHPPPPRGNPDYPARAVMLREGAAADVRWFDVEPCYVFHPMNAYDDGERIVLDVVRHPKMFDTHRLGPDEGPPIARPLDDRPRRTRRCSRSASMTAARSSRGSTSASSGGVTASATASAPPRMREATST